MRKWARRVWTGIILLTTLCGVWGMDASAVEADVIDALPRTEAAGIITEIVDLDGQTHRLEGALDVGRLADEPAALQIRSFALWHGDTLLLESTLQTDPLNPDPNLQFSGIEQTPATLNGYYTAEFMIDETHQVFLTGLTEKTLAQVQQELVASVLDGREFTMTNVDFIDTEKEIQIELEDGTMEGDAQMCWAAATSNMLHYTGWGQAAGFADEDEIFETFIDYFDDQGGQYVYGLDWFFNGINAKQSTSGWAHVEKDYGTFLGYLPDYSANAAYRQVNLDGEAENMSAVVTYLREGYGIGVSFGFYLSTMRMGGHAVTLWGYVRDITKAEYDMEAYTAWLLSDSDSDKVPYQPRRSAPDCLNLMPMQPYLEDGFSTWCLEGYSQSMYTALLNGVTVLCPYREEIKKETEGTKNRFSTSDLVLTDLSFRNTNIPDAVPTCFHKVSADPLELMVRIENAGAAKTGDIQTSVSVVIENEKETVLTKTGTLNLSLSGHGSLTGLMDVGLLPAGTYTATVTVTVSNAFTEAYTTNNTISTQFRVVDPTAADLDVTVSAAMEAMDGEKGGFARLSLTGLSQLEEKSNYLVFYANCVDGEWDAWKLYSRTQTEPESCLIPAKGEKGRVMLVLCPKDADGALQVFYSNEFELQYKKIYLFKKSGNTSKCTDLMEGATALHAGESWNTYAYNMSTVDEPLTFTISYYARRVMDNTEYLLATSDSCTLEKKGDSNYSTSFSCSSWSTPLPAGFYDICARVTQPWGTFEAIISEVMVNSKELVLSSKIEENDTGLLTLSVGAFGPEGSGILGVEYGAVGNDKTKENTTTFTLNQKGHYSAKKELYFQTIPNVEYRYRVYGSLNDTTVYGPWHSVIGAPVEIPTLPVKEFTSFYSDHGLDTMYFQFCPEEAGTYLLHIKDYAGSAYVSIAKDQSWEWKLIWSISSQLETSYGIALEAGEHLYVKMNLFHGGSLSLALLEPSVTQMQTPELLVCGIDEHEAVAGVCAVVPYGMPYRGGVEYGPSKADTTKVAHGGTTNGEIQYWNLRMEIKPEMDWYFRPFVENRETGEIKYGEWEVCYAGKGPYRDLSDQEPDLITTNGTHYFYYKAPEDGWYTLLCETNCLVYADMLIKDEGYGWSWRDYNQFLPDGVQPQKLQRYLHAGETACFKLYIPEGQPSIKLQITGNTVTAVRTGQTVSVGYLPDGAGVHIVALYDAAQRLLETRYVTVCDVSEAQSFTFNQAEASEVRVFQLHADHTPWKVPLQTRITS